MQSQNSQLVYEVQLLITELIRITSLWEEKWLLTLQQVNHLLILK